MDGNSPDKLGIDPSRHGATGRDEEEYTVSVQEASELFAAAGLPRTERAIQRYCKKGELKSAPVDTIYGSKYFITRSSIERLIIQKQQAQQFAPEASSTDRSRPVATVRDRTRQDEEEVRTPHQHGSHAAQGDSRNTSHDIGRGTEARPVATEDKATIDLIKKLQEENFGLKIDVAGKQAFINQIVSERQQLMNGMQDLSYKLGAAETKVAQLEAPRRSRSVARPETPSQDEYVTPTPVGEGSGDAEAAPVAVAAKPPEPTAPVPQEPQPKRSLFGKIFAGK